MATKKEDEGAIITNRKAFRDFAVLDTMECGIVLQGTEVKSLRDHRGNLGDSFARIVKNEVFLFNVHINPYDFGNLNNHEPTRTRKLLLHKREIQRLLGQVGSKGLTLVPLKLYFKNGRVKVQLAIAKGKTGVDKRQTLRRKATELEIQKELRRRQKV